MTGPADVGVSQHLTRALSNFVAGVQRRSRIVVAHLNMRMETIVLAWLIVIMLGASARIAAALTPIRSLGDFAEIFVPYALIALAPIAGYRLASASFPQGLLGGQPSFRFARLGKWRKLNVLSARAHPDFGPFGFMASLLLGMLLNVALRSLEFLASVPAMNGHAPEWGVTIFRLMALDVISMNFLYAVCFVMALRSIPLFPRMLGFAWMMDVFFQVTIAREVAATPHLPHTVAHALEGLLSGNVTKVLISAAIWLPYLLLSSRVNVTYRQRNADFGGFLGKAG